MINSQNRWTYLREPIDFKVSICVLGFKDFLFFSVFKERFFSLSLPVGRKVFRSFLRCEYSEENILFWLACEELKKERSPDMVEEKARIIYEDYVSILSPREVSLTITLKSFFLFSWAWRDNILKSLKNKLNFRPKCHLMQPLVAWRTNA